MEITEKKMVEHTKIIATICDMCKTRYKDISDGHPDVDYEEVIDFRYESLSDDITIERRISTSDQYGDGGATTDQEIHICPKCWTERVLPWLKSQGVKINEKRDEW